MPKIKLTKVILTRRMETKNFPLKDGLEIVYYGHNYGWEHNPEKGIIKEKDNVFTIHWLDGQDPTEINDSKQSQDVLRFCGF